MKFSDKLITEKKIIELLNLFAKMDQGIESASDFINLLSPSAGEDELLDEEELATAAGGRSIPDPHKDPQP